MGAQRVVPDLMTVEQRLLNMSPDKNEDSAPAESLCILVLGVHGSGTSAVAGALCHLGVDMGEYLFGPGPGNPKGHFEDVEFRILLYHWRQRREPEVLQGIVDFLERRYANASLWGIKEPGMIEVVGELGDYLSQRAYRVICTTRATQACVRSCGEKWPHRSAEEVYEIHARLRTQIRVFLETHEPPTLIVDFNALTEHPRAEVIRIQQFIQPSLERTCESTLNAAIEFISPELNHHWEDA